MLAIQLFVIAMLAFALSSLSGGGAGLLLMPVLGFMLPAAQVPAALSVGSTISSASRIALFFRHIEWRIVAWFVPSAVPAVWLGAWLLSSINPLYLELLLALFLLANLPLLIKPDRATGQKRPLPRYLLSLIGVAAGFVSGLTGAVGLIFNTFYLRYGLGKEQVIATRAANEIILHLIKIALYAAFGLLTNKAVAYGLLIGLAALLATWLMRSVLPHLSEALFKRIGYGAMVASGMLMFGNASAGLAAEQEISLQSESKKGGIQGKLRWKDATFSMEFKFDEGFEIEKVISINDLPDDKRAFAMEAGRGAEQVVVEEVYAIGKHYYEVYIHRNGEVTQLKI
jgi:uncharacterized membrane protein YfcA